MSYPARAEGLVNMIKRASVSLVRFSFRFHVLVGSLTSWTLEICQQLFFFHFCFLVFKIFQFLCWLPLLQFVAVNNISLFFIYSSSPYIDASAKATNPASSLLRPFLYTDGLSVIYLRIILLYIVITFLSSSIVYFKNGPEYLSRGT